MRIQVISFYEDEPDDTKIQASHQKYDEFLNKDGGDQTQDGAPTT